MRKSRLAVNQSGDRHEREADRAADAVVAGRAPSFNFSRLALHKAQREDKPSTPEKPERTEDEAYNEAMKQLGEAFLETAPGREIKEKAKEQGEAFVSTLPGKVITGTAIAGAIASLAATEKALPTNLPEIPLDKIKPGLKLKLTYEGPVNKPTNVVATFSFKLGKEPAPKKAPKTESEKRREETVKLQKELYEFHQGLKTPAERAAEERAMYAQIAARMGVKGKPSPVSLGAAGIQMGIPAGPSSSAMPPSKSPAASGVYGPPEMKLTGESETATKEVKKEEEVHRKASSESKVGDAPPIVHSVLASSGQALDASTRVAMETRFGFDFSKVRIHTDSAAAESARAMDAVAYTVGSDIVFGGGTFSPNTPAGEHLLAHELAHIVQQEGLPEVDHSITARPAIQLKKKKNAGTAPDPLDRAMKGDDDDVRDLTNHPSWPQIRINAEQAAHLIIELLKGATFDDDEKAGLKILRRMLVNNQLDLTLENLAAAGRLEQLFDDYDGSEYRQLLKLISGSIENWKVKALVLDVFVAMWWLNTAEERAVVVILENTDDLNDRLDLLTDKNRLDEFRGDIDNHDLKVRFEEAVGEAIGERWGRLSSSLSAIFSVAATESVRKGKRTQEEVDDLLERAANDLTNELADYVSKIEEASDQDNPKKLAEINKEFRRRLDKLVEDKRVEFGMELKYNIEFNRLLDVTFGRKWFQEDLKEIDVILQKIPYDILHANRFFHEFARSLRAPKKPSTAGVAERGSMRIQLRGGLTLSTTAHEIGHFIHYSDETLYKDFQALSEWRYFDRAELPALVNDVKRRERLEKDLDKDYKKGQDDEDYNGVDFEVGDYVYRYSRYDDDPGKYVRRSRKAHFIREYASTEPSDDFADSFGYMFHDPRELQKKAPEKYEFMLVRVLTDYRLSRQKSTVLRKFDDIFEDHTMRGHDMASEVRNKHVTPLRTRLEAALDRDRNAQVAMARRSVKDKPKPIPMDAQAEKLAEPFLEQARRLAKVTAPVIQHYSMFAQALNRMDLFEIDPGVQDAFDHVSLDLGVLLREEFIKELDPYAQRALNGEDIDKSVWPEIWEILKKYMKAVKVLKPYLPRYSDTLIQDKILNLKIVTIVKSLPKNARRDRLTAKLNDLNNAFRADLNKLREQITELIRAGKAFDKRKVKRPLDMRQAYEVKVNKAVRETR